MNTAPAKSKSIHSYRDLRVWQVAMELAEEIYRVTKDFPDGERYGLVNQLRRAAVSVPSNIAEGHPRSSGDYLRHLAISNGSLAELDTQLRLSLKLGFLPAVHADRLLKSSDEIGRMLGGLRKSIRRIRSRTPNPQP